MQVSALRSVAFSELRGLSGFQKTLEAVENHGPPGAHSPVRFLGHILVDTLGHHPPSIPNRDVFAALRSVR
jgi:hypothetical protein